MNLWNESLRTPLAGMQLVYGISHLGNGRKPGSTLGDSIKSFFFGSLNMSTVKHR